MRKIDEVLEGLGLLKRLLYQIENELAYKKANEKQAYMICDLTAKNALLERDNDLLVNALQLKGDTEIVIYRGKCYRVANRVVQTAPDEIEKLDISCFIDEMEDQPNE